MEEMKTWILTDEKPGHKAQAIAVAEALGYDYTEKALKYNRLSSLPNCLIGSSFSTIKNSAAFENIESYPDILIACGRRQAPIARMIKNIADKNAKKLFYTQLMWPGKAHPEINLIAIPKHDSVKLKHEKAEIIKTIGAAHNITKQKLNEAKKPWKDKLCNLDKTNIALIIGGKSGKFGANKHHIKSLMNLTTRLANDSDGSLLITTSRRTDEASIAEIKSNLLSRPAEKSYLYVPDSGDNPYLAILGFADVIFVTGDSISMACEAAGTGKPVVIFAPANICPPKHRKLHKQLEDYGVAKIITGDNDVEGLLEFINNFRPVQPLNVAQQVASVIRETVSSYKP